MNKNIEILSSYLKEMEGFIPHFETVNTNISQTTIGWQLDHSLKVVNSVSGILLKTNPKKYKKDFNFKRFVIFNLGKIPRGRGKAPKQVLPPEIILQADLISQLEKAKKYIQQISGINKNAFFIHHIFGILNKAKTLRFLVIHTNHHLKIIREIDKNK